MKAEEKILSKKLFSFLAFVSIFLILGFFSIYAQENKKFNQDLLVQDTRQLAQIFETAHPDPSNLCRNLRTRDGLEYLLPEWKDVKNIRTRLKSNPGEEKDYIIALPQRILTDPITSSSKIQLPSVEKIDFGYDFLDVKKKTALLRIDGMFSFRENFEYFNMMGVEWVKQYAARTYKKITERLGRLNLKRQSPAFHPQQKRSGLWLLI